MCFNFYKRLEIIGRQIPPGRVATYGQLAMLCGKPKNARQVGYALRSDMGGLSLPAHRVLNSKGLLSGASAFATPDLQKKMLEKEGVYVDKENRVNLKKFQWMPSEKVVHEFYHSFKQEKI